MPDLATAAAAAGAKPFFKLAFKYRPGRMMKEARKAENKVTDILFDRTCLIPDHVYAALMLRRAECDAARTEAEHASYRTNGIRMYVEIVYTYYRTAKGLLEATESASSQAAREHGPEGVRNAAARAPRNPRQIHGEVVQVTLDNVPLHPGQNTLQLPFTSDMAQLCEVTIRAKSVVPISEITASAAADPFQGDSGNQSDENGEAPVSATISLTSDAGGSDRDGVDSQGGDISMSLELSNLGKKRHRRTGPSISIEMDLGDIANTDDYDL
ncbi:hypothetical protein L227DRAFT_602371 [Lentinus tigrinus ALCF2SS1-6]|uniref:Uncharacterized protein n=1 Tax=Lentinus tigrinus ALCF2SS1-6 TaxID=1328759 RepID=A0A5C2S1T0_9APHY|nr:hypothetical protein L227DRAFT_602371 [Lentinus tigrinus ALCF2SS1-6]